ncbi:MAG: hypothetical protein KAT77_01355 [Nanoarchaeota archaeon]|nr:hypothetical protein [Nanoarchaeota archaeon]
MKSFNSLKRFLKKRWPKWWFQGIILALTLFICSTILACGIAIIQSQEIQELNQLLNDEIQKNQMISAENTELTHHYFSILERVIPLKEETDSGFIYSINLTSDDVRSRFGFQATEDTSPTFHFKTNKNSSCKATLNLIDYVSESTSPFLKFHVITFPIWKTGLFDIYFSCTTKDNRSYEKKSTIYIIPASDPESKCGNDRLFLVCFQNKEGQRMYFQGDLCESYEQFVSEAHRSGFYKIKEKIMRYFPMRGMVEYEYGLNEDNLWEEIYQGDVRNYTWQEGCMK